MNIGRNYKADCSAKHHNKMPTPSKHHPVSAKMYWMKILSMSPSAKKLSEQEVSKAPDNRASPINLLIDFIVVAFKI